MFKIDQREFEGKHYWYTNCMLKVIHEFWHQNSAEDFLLPQGTFFLDCIPLLSCNSKIPKEPTGFDIILIKTKIEVK